MAWGLYPKRGAFYGGCPPTLSPTPHAPYDNYIIRGDGQSPTGRQRERKFLPSPRRQRDSPLPVGEGLGVRAVFKGEKRWQ